MRLERVSALQEGERLGKAIVNDEGQVLLNRGVRLTKPLIKRLKAKSITYVYVEDRRFDDIIIKPAVSDQTRTKAITTIKDEFDAVSKQRNIAASYTGQHLSGTFSGIVDEILSDVRHHDEAISLLSEVMMFDSYVFTHSLNVTIYAISLAVELGYPGKKVKDIGLGAILHDVGKMRLPEEILSKKGKLTDKEFQIIKEHPEEGFKILKDLPNIPLLSAHCAYQHHERLNGSGYPRGIKESEIHEYAKVIAVCDVFDAVTSNRVYRDAMLPHEGLEILESGASTMFDEKMVQAFKKTIALYPVGVTVELSGGQRGVVIKQNKEALDSPVVRVIEEKGLPLNTPYEINLLQEKDLGVSSCVTLASNV